MDLLLLTYIKFTISHYSSNWDIVDIAVIFEILDFVSYNTVYNELIELEAD